MLGIRVRVWLGECRVRVVGLDLLLGCSGYKQMGMGVLVLGVGIRQGVEARGDLRG